MKLYLYPLFLFILFQTNDLFAQSTTEQHLEIETRSYASSQNHLPFWLWANQKGRIYEQGRFHQTGLLQYNGAVTDTVRNLKISYGAALAMDLTTRSSWQINEAFVSIAYKIARLKIGEQAAETQLAGLSATNGDFDYSNNSRPYPSLLIGTNGFIKLYKNLSMRAVYEEALIRDKYEYIKNPNLHHKNLFLRWGKPEKLRITAGIDDYAWWGGTSPDPRFGKMLSGFSDYLRVITVHGGGANAYWTEQGNTLGNHLGQYKLTIEKELAGQSFLFYVCHPIDDHSGYKWQNYPDNLFGVFWEQQRHTLISSALVELFYTRNQNVHPQNSIVVPAGQAPVDYFNNDVYQSGHTYKGNVIGPPLFYPVVYDSAGRIIEIANTRFVAFHGGIGGSIAPRDHYKLLMTYSVNSGIWNSYTPKLRRLSTLLEYTYTWNRNLSVNCGLAHDFTHQGAKNKQVLGGYIGIRWKIIP